MIEDIISHPQPPFLKPNTRRRRTHGTSQTTPTNYNGTMRSSARSLIDGTAAPLSQVAPSVCSRSVSRPTATKYMQSIFRSPRASGLRRGARICRKWKSIVRRCRREHRQKDFDLLVLSEIGYYFTPQDWQSISAALIDSIHQGATVLAAHWLGQSQDHRISGDEVHEILLSHTKLRVEHTERGPKMRLDRLVRV